MIQIKRTSTVLLLSAIIFFNACDKKSTSTNTNNTNNQTSTPIATSGTVIFNGKTYPVVSISSYGKYKEKSYNLDIDLSNTDSIIHLVISTASYLPASATIPLSNNIMPLATGAASWVISMSNKTTFAYYQESSLASKSGDIVITNANNEVQYVCNNSQGFNMSATAASKLSFNIKRVNPTIPSVNAAFTIPTGMDANNITVGTSTWNHTSDWHQITKQDSKCKASVQMSNANKELYFLFADGLPVSGTYDIVATESQVAPGKVWVRYASLSPFTMLTPSNTNQKIVVENNNGEVKIYAKNIDLGAEVVNAFLTF